MWPFHQRVPVRNRGEQNSDLQEQLGKFIFLPLENPAKDTFNPCALLSKGKEDIRENATEAQPYQARLLMDLKMGV